MLFNDHWRIEGKHARISASKYHWVNYDDEKMVRVFENAAAAERGDRLHAFAAEAIRLKHRMKDNKQTLNAYVNDAIRFRMTPEQVLYYSENFFGTADTIGFNNSILRINDLKTGVHPGSQIQLDIYAALFCLEYRVSPFDIQIIKRIYQSDAVNEEIADPEWINEIMEKGKRFDKKIQELKEVMA